MRSAALPRFSSKIPGFISYVILSATLLNFENFLTFTLPLCPESGVFLVFPIEDVVLGKFVILVCSNSFPQS